MNAFLEHFHEAVNTPDDVKNIKKYILQLAIQGKLVEQDQSDEPAWEFLKKVEEEKQRLIKEKKIKAQKIEQFNSEDEVPYELPEGWEWVRIGAIGEVFNGNSVNSKLKESKYSKVLGGYDYISTKDIDFETREITYNTGIKIPFDENKFKIAPKNSVLICSEGGSAGRKIGITDKDICFGNKLFAIRTFGEIVNRYIYYFYQSPFFYESFSEKMTGIIGGISLNNFLNILIPIPPIKEQHRVVQKIENLFYQCDQLLSDLVYKQTTFELLNKSISTRLQDHSNHEQMNDLCFVIDNMEHLYNDKESIDQLGNAILSLAVQGKLVKQDANDKPASMLIEKIKEEKERFIAQKLIKKDKPLPPITEDEIPYELPLGWEWVRLGDIMNFLGGYAFKSNTYVEKSNYQVVRLGNVKNDRLVLQSNPAYIPEEIAIENMQYLIRKHDILVTMTGTRNKRDYFYTCIINQNDDMESESLYLNQRVGCLRSLGDINPHLINLFLKSNVILDIIFDTETGTANQGNIGSNSIKEILFPLPPLEEQNRIVAKCKIIKSHLNNLDEELHKEYKHSRNLLDTMLTYIS